MHKIQEFVAPWGITVLVHSESQARREAAASDTHWEGLNHLGVYGCMEMRRFWRAWGMTSCLRGARTRATGTSTGEHAAACWALSGMLIEIAGFDRAGTQPCLCKTTSKKTVQGGPQA